MTDEKIFIKQYDLDDIDINNLFDLFKEKYGFITDEDVILDKNEVQLFVVPLSTADFRYATAEERYITEHDDDASLCLALTKQQYFDFILEKIQFLEDLNGITTIE